MKSVKKLAAILISVSMLFVFTSCNGNDEESGNTADTNNAANVAVYGTSDYYQDLLGLRAKELVAEMKTGWNLGNTLYAN